MLKLQTSKGGWSFFLAAWPPHLPWQNTMRAWTLANNAGSKEEGEPRLWECII